MKIRREKRAALLAEGKQPYPLGYPRTHSLAELREQFAELPEGESSGVTASTTGRVIFTRTAGKLCFARLRDGDGTEFQVMVSQGKVGKEALDEWKRLVDIGDHLGVTGEVVTSKRGELSVMADSFAITAKALRPLPVAHKPLAEETRVRQRYVDLIVRPEARANARNRSAVVRSIREQLDERDFIEVETPMMQVQPGGATARPFMTHMNAYDIDLYMRIAPELYLKRCVVGGIDRVFEINRNFRNEGADSSHSPEFAMLEAYQAYGDYRTIGELTKSLIQGAARSAFGSETVELADGTSYDLGGDWNEITLFGSLSEALGETVTVDTSLDQLRAYAEKVELGVDPLWGHGKLAEELFEHLVVDDLHAPTFVYDYPEDTSPLTRGHRTESGLAEKWDLYVRGFELATGYSELVDPVIQRERLEAQARLAAKGDVEAMTVDEDFLRAMEYGMPPSGGMGMGIDRLLMALTGLGIRETILFPLVKPE
ncbi:lysine--tRNA ligase [Glycomyces buryatensis]|uniref:Lysine--tRNA ligase n=2 Tax=Glycomyces buryatensis TaxID=2570927 RepID=A0A4S8QCH3_9ACTN|nr:lysine--tRNA ligase [Glycomyces buryatensis]